MRVVARPQDNGGADGDCEAVLEQFAQADVDVDAFGCPPAGRGREIDCEIVERIMDVIASKSDALKQAA